MTVSGNTSVRFREFNGHTEPELPAGWWWGETQVIGDATGGQLIARVDFATPPEGQYFGNFLNLEAIDIQVTDAITGLIVMNTQNLDVQENNPRWSLGLQTVTGLGTGRAYRFDTGHLLPLWLGRQRFRGVTTFIAITFANEDDVVMLFHAQGYFWTPRSAQAPGGPQRPPNPAYGF